MEARRRLATVRNLRPQIRLSFMKKLLFPGLLAAALLSLSLTSCGSSNDPDDDNARVTALPPLPAAPDSTKGAKQPDALRELNSVNATKDIKNMQPQM